MTKEEYLNEIKRGLNILSQEEIAKTINNIEQRIEEKEKNGMSFAEIKKELPAPKEYVEKVLKEHGINIEQITKKKSFFIRKLEELFKIINRMVEVMSKNDFQSNMKIIFDLVLLLLFVCLIKIPFILIRYLGESLLQYLHFPIAMDIWGLAIDFVYIVIAIMVFINIFTKWFRDLKSTNKIKVPTIKKEKQPKLGEELSAITLENNSEETKENEK